LDGEFDTAAVIRQALAVIVGLLLIGTAERGNE